MTYTGEPIQGSNMMDGIFMLLVIALTISQADNYLNFMLFLSILFSTASDSRQT